MSKSKIIPINKKELKKNSQPAEEYDFKGVSGKFDEYFRDPSQEHKVFTELGFSWHDDEELCSPCDRNGSCPTHPQDKGMYVDGRLNFANVPELKKIKIAVDVLDIADSMENQSNETESQSYLDIETGEVEFVSHEVSNLIESGCTDFSSLTEWQIEEVEVGKKILADDVRFIPIPKLESHESFKFMEEFVDEVKNNKIAEELISSLRGSRPFRRFKDCLSQHSDVEQQWYLFKNQKLQKVVRDFIGSIDHDRIELVLPRNL